MTNKDKKNTQKIKKNGAGLVKPRIITEEMQESYIDYAMSVIVSRALPDVRDGLKPVHRRILYAMHEMGLRHDAKFRKSATVVGETMGKYHPHGDAAIYDSLARMTQDFSLRYPLIQGQGNFGCFTKDTKVRLADGRSLNFEELIKEARQGKKNYTFAFDSRVKKIEIAEIQKPRLTRKNEDIMEVTIDNGEKIKCTLTHLFMLRDGSYKKAIDLKKEDSLMPLYAELYDDGGKNGKGFQNKFETEGLAGRDFRIQNGPALLSTKANNKNNHKVVETRIIRRREDVYDLTVEPWHNFVLSAGVFVHNSIDGDPPSAMRYSEAKLSKIGEEMMKDIEKNTVSFIDNYDGTRQEPTVLPSPVPQLLLNGSLGIAVGMATNIPTHNISEVCDATIYLIDHPKADTEELFQFIQGPDFPTGGIIYDQKAIIQAYSQGKGPIIARGKAEILEQEKTGRLRIIISEIPFQVQKSTLIEQFANLVQEKKTEGIKNIRDESDREGMRIVIELSRDTNPQKILNCLYKFTDLQRTFHLNMLALVDGIQPRVLNLVELLNYFVIHRIEVVTRRVKFDLEKAKERAHILEGLHKCLANIDAVIKTIKNSASRDDAEKNLIKKFKLTKIQADAILETRLSALARLERKKIEDELKEIREKIKTLVATLKSPQKIKEVVKKELKALKEIFGGERKTKLHAQRLGEIAEEDLIPKEETIITLTQGGYVKRINPKNYKIQNRGGKGILGMKTLQDDVVEHFLSANTHDSLLFFTDSGKVFRTQVYEIPEGQRVARGRGLLNFIEISSQEKVLTLFPLRKEDADLGMKYLAMVTQDGIIKKTNLGEFENVRKSGLIAITLKKDDLLKQVEKSTGNDEVILVTKKGIAIRFKEKDIREMGRQAAGVKGIRLKKGDKVIGMEIITTQNARSKVQNYLLALTENGYGKRTDLKEYRLQGRGGSGIKTANVTSKTGEIVASKILTGEEEDLIVISQRGQVIRTKISQIPKLSRSTQGVRLMRLEPGDKIASSICI